MAIPGPIAGQMFLVWIDAHTKWMELFHVPVATSTETIHHSFNLLLPLLYTRLLHECSQFPPFYHNTYNVTCTLCFLAVLSWSRTCMKIHHMMWVQHSWWQIKYLSIYLSISWDLTLHALAYLTRWSRTMDHALLVRILKSFLQRIGFITWRLPHIILLLMVKWREQCKTGFKKMKEDTISDWLARFLFTYRITPTVLQAHCQQSLCLVEIFDHGLIKSNPICQPEMKPSNLARRKHITIMLADEILKLESILTYATSVLVSVGCQVVWSDHLVQCPFKWSCLMDKLSSGTKIISESVHRQKQWNHLIVGTWQTSLNVPVGVEDLPTKEDMTTPASHATAMSTATNSSPCDFTPSSLPQKPVPSTSGGQRTFRPHACLHCSLLNVVTQCCAYLLTDIGIDFNMLLFNYS